MQGVLHDRLFLDSRALPADQLGDRELGEAQGGVVPDGGEEAAGPLGEASTVGGP